MTELMVKDGKKASNNPPKRALIEEIGNAVSHGVGSAFAVVALILMCLAADSKMDYFGAAVYFICEMLMFTASCLYHSFRHGSAVVQWLGIYLVIYLS